MNDDVLIINAPVKQRVTIAEIQGKTMEALKAYIEHVAACEGTDFLSSRNEQCFDPDIWKILKKASDEVWELKQN